MNKNQLRNLWYSLSAKQRFALRKIYYFPVDTWDYLTGNTHKYVPARGSIYTGSPADAKTFVAQSYHQLQLLKDHIKLQPDDTVLDIGSGIGRTAISLTDYLTPNGRYEGFDVVKDGVEWCQSKIQRDFAHFRFTYVPLFNDLYNTSKLKAEDFSFPYPQNQFDKIFSFSVFTHMQLHEIDHYLGQINQVLKHDGLAFSTFFLYDDSSEALISQPHGFSFPVKKEGYRLMSEKVKSGNIAIHKDQLKAMMAKNNLTVVDIHDGFWKGTQAAVEYQDVVVFKNH